MNAAEPIPAVMPIGSARSQVQVSVARETPKQTMPAAAHALNGTGTFSFTCVQMSTVGTMMNANVAEGPGPRRERLT